VRWIRKIYNTYISDDKAFAQRLRDLLGYTPSKISIYKNAFFHRSNQDLDNPGLQSNERLEYLGDAVLSTVVAEYLFKKYPGSNEGFLTKMRAKIVKRKTLNHLAKSMELDVFLKEFNSTKLSKSMLGNALEALIGAIYLEKGFDHTRKYITECILRDYLDMELLERWDDNFKSQLLEWGQKENIAIDYKVLKRFQHDKRDCFKVGVYVNHKQVSTATDFSIKSAEQKASKTALLSLEVLDEKPPKMPTTLL
jgi:ribonuclease-3